MDAVRTGRAHEVRPVVQAEPTLIPREQLTQSMCGSQELPIREPRLPQEHPPQPTPERGLDTAEELVEVPVAARAS